MPGQRADQQVRRGLSRQALLRRVRVRRHRRAARDRSRQGDLRRRARQRAAARRRSGQRRGLPRAAAAGRHDHGPRAAARRPPHPRHEAQRLRAPVRHRALRGLARDEPHRHGRGRAHRPRAQAQAHPRRLERVPALPGLRALPRDRRRRRRLPHGRHGALRRPRGGGRAPQPGALRRRRHLDRAQDPGRRARRDHPLPRGIREGHQLGRLPGPAGRPARARHRRQGGGLPHRADRGVPRAPAAHGGGRQGAGRRSCSTPAGRPTC